MVENIGPYRVVERLGVGGMGEVYKAYDDRLDRWVAIKRIRPDKEHADDNRERFQREARATAKLNHSSIVHVYDIFLDGDSECIVMEYVEGRTLDTMILEGPLDPTFAARLGYEISSGLAEAHAKGIIHRDLKVENIIITPTGHAKILDFGLAKPIISNELDTSLTGKGQLVGTSRAMSPEYVSGEEIDHRSDLFSFGVLLYEAATGHSPFKAHNTLATLKQVMLHVQTPAFQVSSDIPEDFSNLIDRLLEKDPSDRPQSSDEVALEFENILGGLSSEAIPRPRLGGSSTFRRSSSTFSATATAIENITQRPWAKRLAVFLGIALVGILWMLNRGVDKPLEEPPVVTAREPVVEKKERVLVGEFDNRTGEDQLEAAAYAFRTGLEQASNLEILSKAQVRDALKRMEKPPDTAVTLDLGIELCKREGIKAMVFGSIVRIGDTYQVTGRVINPQNGTSTQTEKAEAKSSNEIIAALNQISQEIRHDLGESLDEIEETAPLQKVTTSDFEALKAYSLGIEELSIDSDDRAIDLFTQALAIDPDFAMAHAKLATGYLRKREYSKALEHLQVAHEKSGRLTSVEKFYVDGWYARLTGTAPQVIQVWTLMTQLYPELYDGYHNKGMALWEYFYDFEEAEEQFEKATPVAGQVSRARGFYILGHIQLALGKLEAARESFGQTPEPWRLYGLAQAALVEGDLAEAQLKIEELTPFQASDTRPLELQLHILAGNFDAASLSMIQDDASPDAPQGNLQEELARRLSAATILEILSNSEAAEFRRALTITPEDLEKLVVAPGTQPIDTAPVPKLSLLGKIAARNQLLDQANALLSLVSELTENKQIPVWNSYRQMLEGEILLANGDEQQALKKFGQALQSAETLQIHESLGRTYRAVSENSLATRHYRWIYDNPGRAVIECQASCFALSTRDWVLSMYNLGSLLMEEEDSQEEAKGYLTSFLEQWPTAADDTSVVDDARSRLNSLQ